MMSSKNLCKGDGVIIKGHKCPSTQRHLDTLRYKSGENLINWAHHTVFYCSGDTKFKHSNLLGGGKTTVAPNTFELPSGNNEDLLKGLKERNYMKMRVLRKTEAV